MAFRPREKNGTKIAFLARNHNFSLWGALRVPMVVHAMRINLRQIEVFRAIMTTGSISGAAQVLYVSQPAVSRLLSYTESRLGFLLFKRIKGRLYPTPEARQLLREVDSVHLGIERVNKLAQILAEQSVGFLHVAASPSLGQSIMPAAIAAFRQRYPDARVRLESLRYNDLKEQVLRHQADLGLSLLPMEHPNLEVSPLAHGRIVCICPRAHPLSALASLQLSDLRGYPVIGYPVDTPLGQHLHQMYDAVKEPFEPAIEVGSPQNTVALVAAGAGVGFVDEFTARGGADDHLVIRTVAGAPLLTAHLVHACYEPLSKFGLAFVQVLRQILASEGRAPKDARSELYPL